MEREKNSRTRNVILNLTYISLSQMLTALLSFYNRKVLLSVVGEELLGVNSLFSDILALFSFADLGIGVAVTFLLYKPIANNDIKRIQSILFFYKKVYRYVIGLLLIISILYIPFLRYLKTELTIEDIIVYYVLFQLNNIIGYLFAYRETYIIACQKERVISIISMFITLGRTIMQIVTLNICGNYIIYLLISTISILIQKLIINLYAIMKCPETRIKCADELSKEEVREIYKKSAAMLVHRVGNLVINQTDSLVVSYILSVSKWGILSNYLMIKTAITTVMARVYSAVLPSIGDVIAKEKMQKQINIFKMYDLLNFWLYAFCFVALKVLSTPFISLYFGEKYIIDEFTIFMLCFAFFIDGLRSPVSAVREAGGMYEKDKWYTILAATVNLVSSITLVLFWGLPGVYMGTILAMLVLIFSRTIILFNNYFNISSKLYLWGVLKKAIAAVIGWGITQTISDIILRNIGISIISFICVLICVCIVPNIIWILIFKKNSEFKMIVAFVKGKIKND